MNQPKVWFPHQSKAGKGIDITPALQYGEPRFVYGEQYSPSYDPAGATKIAELRAAEFDFDHDYLCVASGDPLASIIFAMALSFEADKKGRETIQYLRYSRTFDENGQRSTKGIYLPVKVPIA